METVEEFAGSWSTDNLTCVDLIFGVFGVPLSNGFSERWMTLDMKITTLMRVLLELFNEETWNRERRLTESKLVDFDALGLEFSLELGHDDSWGDSGGLVFSLDDAVVLHIF